MCLKEYHITPNYSLKDMVDLKYCTICEVSDHSLEDCHIMLEKLRNNKIVNLLQSIPKHEVLNTKKLNIITRSREEQEGSAPLSKVPQIKPRRKDN
jgi:hypothetical protein